MRLSASQLKTYNNSPAQRAGKYILWLDEFQDNDATVTGRLFEHRVFTGKDNYDIITEAKEKVSTIDTEKIIHDFDVLKSHYTVPKMKIWDTQVFCEWTINDVEFVGYIDNLEGDTIRDVKTSYYLTKQDSKSINFWSGMTSIEEYELQLWIYMLLTGKKKANILEVAKYEYKKEWDYSQVIEFEMTDDFNTTMEDKRFPIMDEMKALHTKYSFINNAH